MLLNENSAPDLKVNVLIEGFEYVDWVEKVTKGSGKSRRHYIKHHKNEVQSVNTTFTVM